jgi:hypothetical protein
VEDKKRINNFWVFLAILVGSFIFLVGSYLVLSKIAKNNKFVCEYLGSIWLVGDPKDPSVTRGCFTYREMYEIELGISKE